MNERTDRMTPAERRGAPDCLVELAVQWLQLPFAELTETERGSAMTALFLLIAQMRQVSAPGQDWERRRWIDRAVLRLCAQVPGLKGHEDGLRTEFHQRITATMSDFQTWRERFAPPFHARTATGPAESGEGTV